MNSKKIYLPLFFLFLLFAILNWYNACGLDKSFYSRSLNSNSSNREKIPILINNGTPATNKSEIQIQLHPMFNQSDLNQKDTQKPSTHEMENYEMKISDDEDCMGGQWEPFITEKKWTIPEYKEGTYASIFVNFKSNTPQKISDCFSDNIFYDSKAPEIKVNLNQPNLTNKDTVHFIFSGFDSSFFQFQCQIEKEGEIEDNEWTDCTNRKTYENLEPGNYTFQLKATDDLGNSTQLNRSFLIQPDLNLKNIILEIESLPETITNNTEEIQFTFDTENDPTNITCSAGLEDDPSNHQTNEACTTPFSYHPLEGINFFKIEWDRDASTRVEISYQWIVDISL